MDRHETLVSSRNEGHFRARVLPRFQFAKVRGATECIILYTTLVAFPVILWARRHLREQNLSRLGFVLLSFGQANHKTGAPIVTIFSRKCPAVRFDDAAGNREPHSGAFR